MTKKRRKPTKYIDFANKCGKRAIYLYNYGYSLMFLDRYFNVSFDLVKKYLQNNGIKIKSWKEQKRLDRMRKQIVVIYTNDAHIYPDIETHNKFTVIDREDVHYALKYPMCISPFGYAVIQLRRSERFHRIVMGISSNIEIDHIDRDRLNNRKLNLRTATKSENAMNRYSDYGKSKYKGVTWCKMHKKWKVTIHTDTERKFIGYFDNEIDAAKAYDKASIKYHGEFSLTNKKIGLLK